MGCSGENILIGETRAGGSVEKCTGCNLCVKECSFLQRSGNPAELANGLQAYDAFECTLCGLCDVVCPLGVTPSVFFLERRREVHRQRAADDPRHSPLIAYERKGTSRLFTFYGLPKGCDTVFFPGCALPGSRPDAVSQVYEHLKKQIPALGIVLDCCLKPSHDLGREEHFKNSFSEMRDYLYRNGVRNVLVACPNCNRIFEDYGEGISVKTVYELLSDLPGRVSEDLSVEAVLHDPCVARCNRVAQDAARKLVMRAGVQVAEMKHSREMTQCCGRGGGANFIRPGTIAESIDSRVKEAAGRPIITYCAACAGTYATKAKSLHLLDLWMSPKDALTGKTKVSGAPVTYLNRLLLKAKFRRKSDFVVTRERGGRGIVRDSRSQVKAAALLMVIIALAVMVSLAAARGF